MPYCDNWFFDAESFCSDFAAMSCLIRRKFGLKTICSDSWYLMFFSEGDVVMGKMLGYLMAMTCLPRFLVFDRVKYSYCSCFLSECN